MKHLNRILAIALAAILLLGTFTTVFATQTGENKPGTITLNGTTPGKSYRLYRVFDLTYTGEKDKGTLRVAYTINEDWMDFFVGDEAPGEEYLVPAQPEGGNLSAIVVDGKAMFINIKDGTSSNIEQFARDAFVYAVNKQLGGKDVTAYDTETITDPEDENKTISVTKNTDEITTEGNKKMYVTTIENLDLGYYLVYPIGATNPIKENGFLCSLTSTTPGAEVNIKADYPPFDKFVDQDRLPEKGGVEITYNLNGVEYTAAEFGKKVPFTLSSEIPDTTGYSVYFFTFTDTMGKGLTFNDDVEVFVGDQRLDADEEGTENPVYTYTSREDGFTAKINILKLLKKTDTEGKEIYHVGDSIVLQYTATANMDAEVVDNKAKLVFNNDPLNETSTDKREDESHVYNGKIVINKYDANDENHKLSGAKFILGRENDNMADGYEYYKYDEETETVSWVAGDKMPTEVTTGDDGVADFKGLLPGTYRLFETKAPDGYNLSTKPLELTIPKVTKENVNTEPELKLEQTANVPNSSGSELPETGGTGTTIFYVVGGLLVAGAVVLLVTKKRMSAQG